MTVETERDETLRRIAYKLWEERGRPFGTPEHDWYGAEAELRAETGDGATKPAIVAMAEAVGSALGSVAQVVAAVTGLARAEEPVTPE